MATDALPEVQKNPHARTAEGQGSNVPLGWKPTVREPVPVVRCVQIKTNGEQCKRWSLRGAESMKCYFHAGNGNFKNVEERRQTVLEAERMLLTESLPDAVEWMLDLGANSSSDAVRLKAATEIMDRVGLRGGSDLNVTIDTPENAALAVREKLETLRKRVIEGELAESEAHAELESRVTVDPVDNGAPGESPDARPAEEIT